MREFYCPNCHEVVTSSALQCSYCGWVFKPAPVAPTSADGDAAIRRENNISSAKTQILTVLDGLYGKRAVTDQELNAMLVKFDEMFADVDSRPAPNGGETAAMPKIVVDPALPPNTFRIESGTNSVTAINVGLLSGETRYDEALVARPTPEPPATARKLSKAQIETLDDIINKQVRVRRNWLGVSYGASLNGKWKHYSVKTIKWLIKHGLADEMRGIGKDRDYYTVSATPAGVAALASESEAGK